MLTKDERERERYEARQKALRDQLSLLEDASEQGRADGRVEGRAEGRAEGELMGRIHVCERLLGVAITPADELIALSNEELRRRAEEIESLVFRS